MGVEMPTILRGRVYFDLREAANQLSVPLTTMARWIRDAELDRANLIDTAREGKLRYISQSSLKRLFRSEMQRTETGDIYGASVEQPSQSELQSCFISYSTTDHDFADHLYTDLKNKGVRCWFVPHDVQGGKKLAEQIDSAIHGHERLLLVLSIASMKSEWVKTEVAKARKREIDEKRRILFPIRLVNFSAMRDWECFDGDAGKDSAREIREYYVPDFSGWKDKDAYQIELEKLLRDLRTERVPRSGTPRA
jgi:hypothetical protein